MQVFRSSSIKLNNFSSIMPLLLDVAELQDDFKRYQPPYIQAAGRRAAAENNSNGLFFIRDPSAEPSSG